MKRFIYSLFPLILLALHSSAQINFTATLTGNPVVTTGWTSSSATSVSGNTVVLTTNTTNQAGYIYYNTPTTLTTCAEFTVTFDFQVTNSSAPPADGICFWYISTPPSGFTAGGALGLPNNPNGLVLIMDTYDNNSTPNNPLISLRGMDGTFNYTEGSNTGLVGTEQMNQNFVLDGAWHTCTLTYNNGNITVAYDGNPPLITAYYPLNINGYFGFSASTGALYSKHAIRNVNIVGVLPPLPPSVPSATVTYCQFDPATPLTATGTNLKWYTTATGGTALPGAPTPSTSTATTTIYYVSQEGSNGCESNRTPITVVVKPKPNPPASPSLGLCANTGSTTLTATGQNIKWYTTSGGGAPLAAAPVINTATAPANYTYYVSQTVNGCESDRTTVDVAVGTKPPPPTVSSPVKICQYAPGAALTAAGANLKWYTTPTGGVGNPVAPIPQTGYPGITSYYVTQTNNGCESDRIRIDVEIIAKPNGIILASRNNLCKGELDSFYYYGNADVTDVYNWVNPQPATTYISGGGQGPYVVQFNTPGVYQIRMTVNHDGCLSQEATYTVTVKAEPTLDLHVAPTVCAGEVLNVALTAAAPNIDDYTWDFAGGEVVYSSVPAGPYGIRWNTPGDYIISVIGRSSECPTTPRFDTVKVLPLPDARISPVTPVICSGDTLLMRPLNYSDTLVYTWTPAVFFPNLSSPEEGTTPSIVTQPAFLKLEANNDGCIARDSIYIKAEPCCTVSLPSAFSPNGDSRNDIFHVLTIGHHKISSFRVLNRWGQVVFETDDERRGWDGTKAGVPQEMGVYYWYLKYFCTDGKMYEQKGELTLVR